MKGYLLSYFHIHENYIRMPGNSFTYCKDPECWSGRDVNQRPSAWQTGAYPIELTTKQAALDWF